MNAHLGIAWPFSETAVERLGWVLVHSLWQFALVALLAGMIVRALRKNSAQVRYGVLVAAMTLSVAAPVATWLLLPDDAQIDPASGATSVRRWVQASLDPPSEPKEPTDALTGQLRPGESTDISTHRQGLEESTDAWTHRRADATPLAIKSALESDANGVSLPQEPKPSWSETAKIALRPWLAWIVIGWGLGVIICSLRPLLGWHTLRRLRCVGTSSVSDDVLALLRRVSARLGLRHSVRVLQSTLSQVPIVVGYVRPVILLPVSLLTTIPVAQLEAILAHELAHVQRHDFVVNLLQTLIETLFFYHPAIWWLSRRVRIEREHCCDDLVVALLGNRVEYGRALVAIEQLRGRNTVLALGATDGSLLSRVRRIAGLNAESASRWPVSLLSLASLGMAIALSIGRGFSTNQSGASIAAMDLSPDSLPADIESELFPLPKPEDVSGLDLSKTPMRSYEATYQSTPELYVPDPANPGSWKHPSNVFPLPLAEHTWLLYPGGSGHFYITHRHDGAPESEQIYGPIAGDPFDVLKLEDLLRERLRPGSKSENARYRLRLMFRTGEPGLVRRAWRMIEPELAPMFSSNEQGFYDRFELFEGVRDALRDRAEAFHNPELQDVVTKARRRVEAAEAEFDELNDSVSDESYQSATYLQPKIAAKIPDALWGQPLDGLRLALVPRESQPTGSDWNELPLDTPLPKSVTTQIGGELHYQLLVENVSDHEIKFFAYISSTDVDRTLEIVDQTGKPLIPGFGTRLLIPQHFSYWRLKPGERQLLAMSAVCFTSADVTYTGLGMFVNSAPGQYTLRCSMRFGHYDNNRHRHLPGKTEWIGQLTTGAQKITVVDPLAANDDGIGRKRQNHAETDALTDAKENAGSPISLADAVAAVNKLAAEQSLGVASDRMPAIPREKWPAPVTVAEVVTAIRGWDRDKVPVADETYRIYQRIAEAKVLPPKAKLMFRTQWFDFDQRDRFEYRVWVVQLDVSTSETTGFGFPIRDRILDQRIALRPSPNYSWIIGPQLPLPAGRAQAHNGMIVIMEEDRDGALIVIATRPLKVGGEALRVVAFDVEGKRYDLDGQRLAGSNAGPDQQVFERFRLDPSKLARDKVQHVGIEGPDARELQKASATPKGLEFLVPYPKLHGLSLDMTEPQFLEIAEKQKLTPRKSTVEGGIRYSIPTGDGHTVIVMFGNDNGNCKGIQRVRGESAPGRANGDADRKKDDGAVPPPSDKPERADANGPDEKQDDSPARPEKSAIVLPDHVNVMAVGFVPSSDQRKGIR